MALLQRFYGRIEKCYCDDLLNCEGDGGSGGGGIGSSSSGSSGIGNDDVGDGGNGMPFCTPKAMRGFVSNVYRTWRTRNSTPSCRCTT